VRPFAERMLRDERLELARQRSVATECELGVDSILDRGEP